MLYIITSQQNSSDIILYVNVLHWQSPTLVSTLSSRWGAVVITIVRSWSRYSFCCIVSSMWSLSACRIWLWNSRHCVCVYKYVKSQHTVYCTLSTLIIPSFKFMQLYRVESVLHIHHFFDCIRMFMSDINVDVII